MTTGKAPGATIVGTGFGVFTHLRALRKAGFEVRSLVGRDRAKAEQRAKLFGVPDVHTSLAAALQDPAVQVVTVATPPTTHHGFVLEAAAAGKHILCEKPFALSLAQAREMLAGAQKAGIVHLLGVEFRFAAAHELLRRVIAAGQIGTVRHAAFVWYVPVLADPANQVPAWWEDARQSGGFLGAWGSHRIDQVRVTLGEIDAVSGSLQTLRAKPGVTADDTFTVQFRTESGITGVLIESMATAGDMFSLVRITGTAGAAWIQGDEVWVCDNQGNKHPVPLPADLVYPPPEPFPHPEIMQTAYEFGHSFGTDLYPYVRLFEGMRERIAGRAGPSTPPLATFADGVAVQAVVDAIKQSSAERRWVDVDHRV